MTDKNGRASALKAEFIRAFGTDPEFFISSPGRTEICGNHCDHQNGCVVAAAVDADICACAGRRSDQYAKVISPGHKDIVISLDPLCPVPAETGSSPSLARGIASALKDRGIPLTGINAVTNSHVPSGSGLSSSAAFENLMTKAFLSVSGHDLDAEEIAVIGRYAENAFFGKPSGLMDQMASAVGGLVFMDFKDPDAPAIEKLDSGFLEKDFRICITNTGGSHADLADEFAAVPAEMKRIAGHFGKNVLREVNEDLFYDNIPALRKAAGDRAVLRAMHFFEENKRAAECRSAILNNDLSAFLDIIIRSGESSWKYLQNIYPSGAVPLQEQALGLALSEKILKGKGAWRIHGGGFAGTIQAFVPQDLAKHYKSELEKVFGRNSCRVTQIRARGPVSLAPHESIQI